MSGWILQLAMHADTSVSALYKKIWPKNFEGAFSLAFVHWLKFKPGIVPTREKETLQFLMNSEIFQKEFLDLGSKEHNVQDYFNIQSFYLWFKKVKRCIVCLGESLQIIVRL